MLGNRQKYKYICFVKLFIVTIHRKIMTLSFEDQKLNCIFHPIKLLTVQEGENYILVFFCFSYNCECTYLSHLPFRGRYINIKKSFKFVLCTL